MAYNHLSSQLQDFVANLSKKEVPRTIQEVLQVE